MNGSNDSQDAWFRLTLAWMGNLLAAVVDHLNVIVLLATLAYTLVNLYVLVRDKIWRKRNGRTSTGGSHQPEADSSATWGGRRNRSTDRGAE